MDSDWAWLAVNILDSILEKIKSTRDYLQFGAVCTSWHSVAEYNATKRNNSASHEFPMLMIPREDDDLHDLYDLANGRFLKSKLAVPFHKRFCGSSLGWLVAMNEDFSVTLYKPRLKIDDEEIKNSAITIRLPAMDIMDDPGKVAYIVKKVAISADPLTNPNQCTVMLIYDAGMKLAYIRPSKDAAWSYVDLGKGFSDVIHCGNKFYVLTVKFGELISFDETDDERPFNLSPKLIKTAQLERFAGNRYLVELNGKLLQVERRLAWDTRRRWRKYKVFSRLTEEVIVYELDFNSMSWIEIRDIGDFALFLGDNSSMSVIASNFDGCKPNLIYFTHDQDPLHSSRDVVNDFGVYNISTGVMDLNFDMDTHSLSKMMRRIPIWIEPRNINQS